MERQLDVFVMSRPDDRYSGGSAAIVREAQRRARRRAFLKQKRQATADERNSEDLEVSFLIVNFLGPQRPIVFRASVMFRTALPWISLILRGCITFRLFQDMVSFSGGT